MKKLFYLFILAISTMLAGKASAQYHITWHTETAAPDSTCDPVLFTVNTNLYSPSLTVHSYYGDGTDDVNPITATGTYGQTNYNHYYTSPGDFTVKQVLLSGGLAVDSVHTFFGDRYCQTPFFGLYKDANGNCVYDSSELPVSSPVTVAIDSNGVFIDTVVTTSGIWYRAYGNPNDIYGFHVIATGSGVTLTCPLNNVVYDTLSAIVNDYVPRSLGLTCSVISGYDAAELVSTKAGRHSYEAHIIVSNQYCTASPVTLTMNMNSRYHYTYGYPIPTSVSGQVITWVFPSVSALFPQFVTVYGEVPGALNTVGDTVLSSYYVTPTVGDANPANNSRVIIDTVTGSWDPNDKTVSPEGYVSPGAGTTLTYTLRFENTGNDTAFNIHIMDTLSDNLNVKSLAVLGSSATMNLAVMNNGGPNIVKFDFPGINLLDSSHHGQCDGMVMFTIKTKDWLPVGTHIDNRAGIYFDYNPVVMTNTVENIVGGPVSVAEMTNAAGKDIDVFPNPAGNELTIRINKGTFSTISIINSVGQEVMKQSVSSASNRINAKSLPAGSYFISVRGESGTKMERFQKL